MPKARPRSVSVVALLADVPSTGQLGEAQAQRFPLEGEDLAAQGEAFLEFARYHVDAGRKVVALYPSWHSERAVRAIRFARGALQSDSVAAVAMDFSPLAMSLAADQLAYLAPYLPSGLVAALPAVLPEHMLAGGWLKSVTNLATIPISVRQHLGSYAPGSTFLAFSAPTKRVGRVRKGSAAANISARPVEPIQMLIARPEGHDIDAFNNQFTPAVRPVSISALPEQPLGAKYWGSKKYIEFVAFSAHPQALTQTVRAIRPTACVWCREPVAGLHCPFCRAANHPPVGRPPTRGADVPPPPARNTGEHVRPAWVGNDPGAARPSAAGPPPGAAPPQQPPQQPSPHAEPAPPGPASYPQTAPAPGHGRHHQPPR
ncbi:hypothetical protein CLV63_12047 [Murinocardiopsis flavida]|uniref:Uncharacterized protein n=1 Tax=Murinocardiopsis flavida TaxID=645275 RepID=A0A2P8D289_9ACTN|nr:hypothetical protein [Murinocardiopsis flavida]PSK91321.1 hypothetical protein CLV63_12047 [Murinocardiopsis flavida]